MSLIREALRKSTDENEPPLPFPPNLEGGGNKKGSGSIKKYGLVIFLLLCLSGVVFYQFFPHLLFPKKSQPPAAQKEVGGNRELPQPVKVPVGEPASGPQAPVFPPVAPNKIQEQSPVKERATLTPLMPRTGPKKEEPPKLFLGKKFQETGTDLKTDRLHREASPRFFSPRPVARGSEKSLQKKKTLSKLPESLGPPESKKPQAEISGKDSLEVVRLFNEAVREQQKGLFPQSIQNYQEVLELRPNHWETYNNLGLIYQEQKRFPRALEMFQKALSLNPQYLKGINNLGLLYLTQGKWEEAVTRFKKSLDLDPQFIPAYINLSTAYKRQGKADLARKTLYQALNHDAENIEAQYNLGLLWEDEGVENKALEHYQKFVSKAEGPYCNLANELKRKWPGLK
jgi:hypothetical protein